MDSAHHLSNKPRTIRYGELKRAIPNISEKILIDTLKFLCDKGLVKKEQYPEVPPRVEYSPNRIRRESTADHRRDSQVWHGEFITHLLLLLQAFYSQTNRCRPAKQRPPRSEVKGLPIGTSLTCLRMLYYFRPNVILLLAECYITFD